MASSVEIDVDEEHKNWLSTALSLNIVRDVLGSEIEQEINKFHNKLKQNPPMCGQCDMKKVKFDKKNKKWTLSNNCAHCQPWLDQVSAEHSSKIEQNVYKDNSDLKKWPTNSWEIAKFYMPRGQGAINTGPEKSDCAALISMMTNCKLLITKFGKPIIKQFQELSTLRNHTYHSADMRLSKQKLRENIDKMIAVINKVFQGKQQAVVELKKMRDEPWILPGEKFLAVEVDIIKHRLTELIEKVEEQTASQDGARDTEAENALIETMKFIANEAGEELREELEPSIKLGLKIVDQLQAKMEAIDQRMDESEVRITSVEDKVKELNQLKEKFESLKVAGSMAKVTVDHKGQLQTYAQSKSKSKALPNYEFFPHAQGGYVATVTIDGKTFEITEPHLVKTDAEKAVAKKALIELGQLRGASGVSGGASPSPTTAAGVSDGARPKHSTQPAAVTLTNAGNPSPVGSKSPDISRQDKIENITVTFTAECTNAEKSVWVATAEFESSGVIQLPQDEAKPSKKDAKQAIASMVLEKISVSPPAGSKPAEFLHGHCGKNKKSQPDYLPDEVKNSDGKFGCVVVWEELTNEEAVLLQGAECNSAEDALIDVKGKTINLIGKLPKEGAKSTGTSAADLGNSGVNKAKADEIKKSPQAQAASKPPPKAASVGATSKEAGSSPVTRSKKTDEKMSPAKDSTSTRNYVGELKEYFDECKDFEKAREDPQSIDGKFKHTLTLKANDFREFPKKTYATKKEAEKYLALHILNKIYPDVSATIVNAKNVLQEKSVKELKCTPKYKDKGETGAQVSSCELIFQVSSQLCSDKSGAKQDAYRKALDIVKRA